MKREKVLHAVSQFGHGLKWWRNYIQTCKHGMRFHAGEAAEKAFRSLDWPNYTNSGIQLV